METEWWQSGDILYCFFIVCVFIKPAAGPETIKLSCCHKYSLEVQMWINPPLKMLCLNYSELRQK